MVGAIMAVQCSTTSDPRRRPANKHHGGVCHNTLCDVKCMQQLQVQVLKQRQKQASQVQAKCCAASFQLASSSSSSKGRGSGTGALLLCH